MVRVNDSLGSMYGRWLHSSHMRAQGDTTTKPAFAGTTVDAMTDAIYERKYELDSLIKYVYESRAHAKWNVRW